MSLGQRVWHGIAFPNRLNSKYSFIILLWCFDQGSIPGLLMFAMTISQRLRSVKVKPPLTNKVNLGSIKVILCKFNPFQSLVIGFLRCWGHQDTSVLQGFQFFGDVPNKPLHGGSKSGEEDAPKLSQYMGWRFLIERRIYQTKLVSEKDTTSWKIPYLYIFMAYIECNVAWWGINKRFHLNRGMSLFKMKCCESGLSSIEDCFAWNDAPNKTDSSKRLIQNHGMREINFESRNWWDDERFRSFTLDMKRGCPKLKFKVHLNNQRKYTKQNLNSNLET